MTRTLLALVLALVLVLALAAPAFAVSGSGGAGAAYGLHHSSHAIEMGGFSGEMNPGVMHRGFSGWPTE